MFVRIGLVVVAGVLVSLILLGIGVSTEWVSISTDGITFGHADDAVPQTVDRVHVVSADKLLHR